MGTTELFVMLALISVIIAMTLGLWSMGRGGSLDRALSVPLMYIRIGLHALAVALLLLALFLGKS